MTILMHSRNTMMLMLNLLMQKTKESNANMIERDIVKNLKIVFFPTQMKSVKFTFNKVFGGSLIAI